MTPQPHDWRELAEKVSNEMDPDKLEVLIDELNRTLDRDERCRQGGVFESSPSQNVYDGTMNKDNSEITSTWKQPGTNVNLIIERTP